MHEHIEKLFRVTAGTFEVVKWDNWLVGLTHVAALQSAQAQGDGVIFRSHMAYVVGTDQNDLLSSIRVYFENESDADAFFAGLHRD